MQRSYFVSYILILVVAWLQVYGAVRELYGEARVAREDLRAATERARGLEHRLALAAEDAIEFRQDVASILPTQIQSKGTGPAGYRLRSLASVVSPGPMAEPQARSLAKELFERGSRAFDAKRYAESNRIFEQVITKFGYTSYVPRAYFLLADGLFQLNELEQATETIQRMVELFPVDESTGFAMVRLGRIYEERKLNDLAVDIYKTVLRTFPQRDIATLAKTSLRGIEL